MAHLGGSVAKEGKKKIEVGTDSSPRARVRTCSSWICDACCTYIQMLKEASSAGNIHSAIRGFIAAMVALLTKPDVEASAVFTVSVWFAKVRDTAGQNCKASNGMRASKALPVRGLL